MKRKQEALKVLHLQTHPEVGKVSEVGVSDQQTHLREALLAVDAGTKEQIKVQDKRNKDQDYLKQVGF